MTAFFFVPGSEIIFTIIGIVVMIWFFGSAIGRLFGGAGTDMLGEPIHVKVSKSANGKLVVKNAKYTEYDRFYSAEIVDATNGEEVFLVVARDREKFDSDLKRQLEFWSKYPRENHK